MTDEAAPYGIVVGADGSPSSLSAVRWAATEAGLRHLRLTVAHVHEGSGADEADSVLDEATAEARNAAGVDGPDVEGRRLTGQPAAELVELSGDAQLVVVGSRGRTGRSPGSVGLGLLHHARCPVVVVHDDLAPRNRPGRRPVLVGIDGSKTSLHAAAIAFEEASRRSVDLLALHVCKDADTGGPHDHRMTILEEEAADFLRETLADLQQRFPEVVVRPLIRFANPTRQLLVQAERSQLVVVGSHGRGAIAGRLLGSVSAAVAEGCRIPVIVARRT
ncbi:MULTISPECIES: universal stress protein [Mycolicibacterium]|uniref:Universal stress protein UspA-like protein n=3 Tax=Mycolicibacterium gilvum TaxID=1804 RepID=E6TE50_MYCSR|nr:MULTISPECIES: universal stress protein [Mycolicibacterium]ABP47451.1 UspA domain protein [Mycolicibacterium gilvum PYR-GCK]ADU00959.1 universal stress protein UspA-like protein [Mycolicibacterium gilvum Spyr1]MBV5242512.1 universal stress protein [Mycolicibacterium sp. PAM1]MCV7058612.1 universal stress protein [Mycolicibacterium gilvum]STZ42020.1 UspA domain-containing protein [Mycolicibacterium gilvum]